MPRSLAPVFPERAAPWDRFIGVYKATRGNSSDPRSPTAMLALGSTALSDEDFSRGKPHGVLCFVTSLLTPSDPIPEAFWGFTQLL